MNELTCYVCNGIVKGGVDKLAAHLKHTHGILLTSRQGGFLCGQNGCKKTFKLFSSFRRHIIKQHGYRNKAYTHIKQNETNQDDTNHEKEEISVDRNTERNFDVKAAAAKMVADLRSNHSFTGAAITKVLDVFSVFMKDFANYAISEAEAVFRDFNIPLDAPKVDLFKSKIYIEEPFEGLMSLNGQIEALKKHCNYIEPVEIPLGLRREQTTNSMTGETKIHNVKETFQYVPIINVLASVLSNSTIKNYVDSETSSSDRILRNFRDAESFQNNPFFQKYPQALRLQLYYDDVSVNNPLGSKVFAHKIGAFYYTIQNIPSEYNSMLGAIHLLLMCNTSDIQKYGMTKVLAPFLHDLQKLESDDGVDIILNDQNYKLRASIACFCADGMAAHQVFGFLSPSARHFCRLCMITREQLHGGTNTEYAKRSKDLYNDHVLMVATNRELESATGIRENSALHASKYFHCTDNYVFDPMHDLLEGICPMEIKLVLKYYICDKKYFDVENFNDRIHLFAYGIPEAKNKPSANFTLAKLRNVCDHALPQNAIQMWCLMRVFPFLVSDKIPDDDKHLSLILLLNRILEIVLSPQLNMGILPYLHELINDHQELFKRLFPDTNFINKHHHLRHYCECIKMSGPMRNIWCMRFEGKHNVFKKHANVCGNFKNLPKTMARLCQISQSSYWGLDNQLPLKLKCEKGSNKFVKETLCRKNLLELGFSDSDTVFVADKIILFGTAYYINFFIAIENDFVSGFDPVFAKIVEIVILHDEVHFYCQKWQTVGLHSKLNAYHIVSSDNYCLIDHSTLSDFKPFALWYDYKNLESFISLRHVLL